MAIIIREIDNEYWLCSVSHSPVNLQPFTKPNEWNDFSMLFKCGRMRNLCGFELDKEYDLDEYKDFIISERIPKVKHEWGFSDDLFYSTTLYLRKEKIKKLCQSKKIIK